MNLLKYSNFLTEKKIDAEKPKIKEIVTSAFEISDIFKRILINIDDDISKSLLRLVQIEDYKEVTLIDKTDIVDTVSYTRAQKVVDKDEPKNDPDAWTTNRATIKIGRLVVKLFGDLFSNKDVELFVNKYKALSSEDPLKYFEVVSGKTIRILYCEDNYEDSDKGSLGNSCMRYEKRNNYMKFYSLNPTVVSMIVLWNEEKTKIKGRALLWNLLEPEGKIYMDRIYTNKDHEEEIFKEYAKKNGWYYRYKQDCETNDIIVVDGIKTFNFKLKVQMVKSSDDYPYMDTFKYYNSDDKILSNYIIPSLNIKLLEDTDGGYKNIGEEDFCETYTGEIICYEESVYLEEDNTHARADDPNVIHEISTNNYFLKSRLGDRALIKIDRNYYFETAVVKIWTNLEKTEFRYKTKEDIVRIDHRNLRKDYFIKDNEYYDLNLNENVIFAWFQSDGSYGSLAKYPATKTDKLIEVNKNGKTEYYSKLIFSTRQLEENDNEPFALNMKVVKDKIYSKKSYCRYGGESNEVPLGTEGIITMVNYNQKLVRINFINGYSWSVDMIEIKKV